MAAQFLLETHEEVFDEPIPLSLVEELDDQKEKEDENLSQKRCIQEKKNEELCSIKIIGRKPEILPICSHVAIDVRC